MHSLYTPHFPFNYFYLGTQSGEPSLRGNGARSGTKVHIAVKDDNPGQNKKGIILIKIVKYDFPQ